ncbi:MAG: helix-turn-helix domain-containing protein [Nitrospinota bacterium]
MLKNLTTACKLTRKSPHDNKDRDAQLAESAHSLGELGDSLRRIREDGDVSINEISQQTKVQQKYLDALETGDFERLPGIFYGKGYLRAYLSVLGHDHAPWSARFEELAPRQGGERSPDPWGVRPQLRRRRIWRAALLLSILGALLLFAWGLRP